MPVDTDLLHTDALDTPTHGRSLARIGWLVRRHDVDNGLLGRKETTIWEISGLVYCLDMDPNCTCELKSTID